MPILFVLTIAVQVYFAVHAVKSGRSWYWLYIIILFPGVGCLVYFFAEYLPELRADKRVHAIRAGIERTVNPTKRLRALKDQVELTPSLENKQLLAQEYVNVGMFDDAISTYKDCMQGMYAKDLTLVEGLARAYYMAGDLRNARQTLETLRELRGDRKGDEADLLYAKVLEESGDIRAALQEYPEVAKSFLGEEARCRYALLLRKVGKAQEANELFAEILRNGRLSERFYRNTQKQWIDIAKREKT
ncbi:MAG: hypothetical protein AB1646_08805 [Thermodesulfobacteriota bacterium]